MTPEGLRHTLHALYLVDPGAPLRARSAAWCGC